MKKIDVREMIDRYQPTMVKDKRHLTFLVHYMGIMMTVSSILLMKKNTGCLMKN